MAQMNGKTEASAFSERQWKLIKDVINKRGFGDAKITEHNVGVAGDNYQADVKRVVAEKKGETFKIVAKIAPRIEQLRAAMNSRKMFIIEHVMYTEVLPKFTELEQAAGIPEDNRLRYAACYGTITEEMDELVLLEDLKESDHTMLDRFKSLQDGEMKLILQSFAKLHALSYVLKNQEPETFANYASKLLQFEEPPKETSEFLEAIEAIAISKVQGEKRKKCLKDTVSKQVEFILKYSDWNKNSRYSVIQQGDSWTNNIMFQLKDGKAVSCCMIDYQMSRLSNPADDLMHSIMNCTNHETRKQHFSDWIDHYYSELGKYLYEFNLKADYVYPRDQLEADLKRHGKLALASSTVLSFYLSKDSEEAKQMKAQIEEYYLADAEKQAELRELNDIQSFVAMSEKTSLIFRARIEGCIDTCLEFGLI
ncbi:ecdysteroid kinase domain-containing protein [Phthorimaea operculella]|nr:ecdysteroid kinase domain-containing protein [Phthorimaea operculella]